VTVPYVQPAPQQPSVPGVEAGAWNQVERLAAARRAAGSHRPLTDEELARLDRMEGDRCFYCTGFHAKYCPRVREIEFHPNGNLARVAYWHDNQVDWSGVVFDNPPEAAAPEPE
jgi:hypothetical protein